MTGTRRHAYQRTTPYPGCGCPISLHQAISPVGSERGAAAGKRLAVSPSRHMPTLGRAPVLSHRAVRTVGETLGAKMPLDLAGAIEQLGATHSPKRRSAAKCLRVLG